LLLRIATLVFGLAFAMPARAAVITGDQFTFNWTETSPNAGVSGTAAITIGAPAAPGFFGISSFLVFENGGFCGTCTPLTEDLSAVLFDALTLGLLGDVTGTFLGGGGALHTFDLALTDLPGGGFTFTNIRVSDGNTQVSVGIYDVVQGVDEPPTLLMLGLALAVLALLTGRRAMRALSG
jgi:hypothetical protein